MTSQPIPSLDAEADVDLGLYARALAARWWLLLAGLVAGAAIGYVLSLGGHQVFRAESTVYLGQPLGIFGGSQVQSANTNPSTASAIVRAESNIREVAASVRMSPSQLRSGVSAHAVQGSISKLGQTPLVVVSVTGPQPVKVRAAAEELAKILVSSLSGYSSTKIDTLSTQLSSDEKSIALINGALNSKSISQTDKLLLQLRLTQVQTDRTQATQLLALARNVEAPRILTHGSAQKTTARSHRNSTGVGGLIGLILGGIAALLWEPLVTRRRAS